ncbi:MAG: chromate transporter [Butyricicoccus sp.]
MIYWTLFWTFARIALCTLGGGAATIPYLMELPDKFGWVTPEQLAVIIAVGESAPGPGGVNMASYIGFETAGIGGVLAAVVGLCLPSVILVTIIATFLRNFSKTPAVQRFFYGLRPAVVAVIVSAVLGLMEISLLKAGAVCGPAVLIFMLGCVFTNLPQTRKLHPLVLIGGAAVLGIAFGL